MVLVTLADGQLTRAVPRVALRPRPTNKPARVRVPRLRYAVS
jgi:hypothetical protein